MPKRGQDLARLPSTPETVAANQEEPNTVSIDPEMPQGHAGNGSLT
jgi:hypothetical protein